MVRGTQASRPGLNCDARPALESGWRDELAATKDGERFIACKKARGDGAARRDSSHPQADPSQEVKGKKESACSVRNDRLGRMVRGTQASRPGLNCDAPPALRADGEMNSPLQRMGKSDAHFSTDLPLTSTPSPFVK